MGRCKDPETQPEKRASNAVLRSYSWLNEARAKRYLTDAVLLGSNYIGEYRRIMYSLFLLRLSCCYSLLF